MVDQCLKGLVETTQEGKTRQGCAGRGEACRRLTLSESIYAQHVFQSENFDIAEEQDIAVERCAEGMMSMLLLEIY